MYVKKNQSAACAHSILWKFVPKLLSRFQGSAAIFTLLTKLTVEVDGSLCAVVWRQNSNSGSGMKAELKQIGSEYLSQTIRIKNKIELKNELSSVLQYVPYWWNIVRC